MLIEVNASTKMGNRICPLLNKPELCKGPACAWFMEIPPLPYEQRQSPNRGNCAIARLAAMHDV